MFEVVVWSVVFLGSVAPSAPLRAPQNRCFHQTISYCGLNTHRYRVIYSHADQITREDDQTLNY